MINLLVELKKGGKFLIIIITL